MYIISSVQSLSHVQLFVTPWIAAHQASLSITNSRGSLRLTSIESVMPSSHLILCHPLLLLPQSLPASGSFPMSQLFTWGGQSIGVSVSASVSASASVLPMNTKGLISFRMDWLDLLAIQFSSVQFSHLVVSNSLWPHELQHARHPCPSPTPGVRSNSRPLSRWCHPAIPFILFMGLLRQEYWSGLPFSSPGDLPNQGSNWGLPHCGQILYCLSHQGSPKVQCALYNVCTRVKKILNHTQ